MRLQSSERMQKKAAMEANFGCKPAISAASPPRDIAETGIFIKLSSCRQREIQRVF
jgi:hypothetical protein